MEIEAAGEQQAAGAAESALLRRLRAAEAAACTELAQRFGPLIHRFAAARLAGDGELAEDVMVQTLADAVRNIHRFDPKQCSLAGWLLGIARRQVQGERRRQRRRKSVPRAAQVALATDLPTGDDLAAAAAARVEAQRQVAVLSSFLTDIEFEVLVLTCVGELSTREVGRIVSRSERAIHSLLHRARRKARERLTQDE